MRIEYDEPLDFERVKCEICGQVDDDWRVMHFLADGVWRKLVKGKTLREQGIDEQDSSRLYCIHSCTEAVMRTFITLSEIEDFYSVLRGKE
jgi:hypothetical protein